MIRWGAPGNWWLVYQLGFPQGKPSGYYEAGALRREAGPRELHEASLVKAKIATIGYGDKYCRF